MTKSHKENAISGVISSAQMKITASRSDKWEEFKDQSRYSKNSDILYEAVVLALRFREIQRKMDYMAIVPPELVQEKQIDVPNKRR